MQGLDPHRWATARAAALARDGNRCQAEDRFGPIHVRCRQSIGVHVHHVDPAAVERGDVDPYDLDYLLTLCPVHHARLHHKDPALRDRRRRRARGNAAAYRPFAENEQRTLELERDLLDRIGLPGVGNAR